MSEAKDRKDALAALVQTALGSDVAVLAGVDPLQLDGDNYPEFACIVLTSSTYRPNVLLNAVAQESDWSWSIFVGIGSGGTQDDAYELMMPKLEALITALLGQRLTATCSTLELQEFAAFHGWRPGGGVIYRQDWTHMAFAN